MQYTSAGDSHGPLLLVIVQDLPAGLKMDQESIATELGRRRGGLGRSKRQEMEGDEVTILSGLRQGVTTGAPVAVSIANADARSIPEQTIPRPGHADLLGACAAGTQDCAGIAERASARRTATQVVAGAFAKMMLSAFGVSVSSYFQEDGEQIESVREVGDTLGSQVLLQATGLVPGLGGYDQGQRLTSSIASALFDIPTVRQVSFADDCSAPGSAAHDSFQVQDGRISRSNNPSWGLEAGMTTGGTLQVLLGAKALPTVDNPRESMDLATGEPAAAPSPRHDTCVTAALATIAEAQLACVLADAYQDRFGHACLEDMLASFKLYSQRLSQTLEWGEPVQGSPTQGVQTQGGRSQGSQTQGARE